MPVLGGYHKQEQPRRLSGRFLVFIANKNQQTSSHYIYIYIYIYDHGSHYFEEENKQLLINLLFLYWFLS
jgi:hypothetical protein